MKRIALILSLLMTAMSTTFCSQQLSGEGNPLLTEWDTPYGVPPFNLIKAKHYAPAFKQAMSVHNAEIDAIVSLSEEPTFENTIAAFDKSGEKLSSIANIFSMMCAALTDEDMQKVEEKVMPQLAAHNDAIYMNDALFKRIKVIYDKRSSLGLDEFQTRLVTKIYTDFVRSGALLDEAHKKRLKVVNEELSVLSVRFGNNILAENNDFTLVLEETDTKGLPKSVKDAAAEKAKEMGEEGKYIFTLHKPSLLPFLTYSSERDLREKLYKGYLNRCNNDNDNDNKDIINQMMALRTEKAHLLGYKSYAHYVTSEEMSGSPEAVYALINDIWTPALAKAREELAEMERLFRNDVKAPNARFESWDWWYYAEKVRKQKYALDEEMTSPYFALDNVRQGAFNLANRLYGLTFRPVIIPTYHDEASAYEVLDNDGSHLGILYFDFHPRASKSQGAWCGYFRTPSRDEEGNRIAPVVSIVCNFTRPTEDTPALLTIDEVTTLFHEFGHALHFLFSDVPYNGLLDVEGDFVELPSQIMENWALRPELLKTYAVHHRNNQVISQALIQKIERSRTFNQGFATTELLAATLVDMDIHSIEKYATLDINDFERKALYEKRGLIREIEPRYRLPYFAHIFSGGYSAGYYFYTWAEVLDKDAFEAFVETKDLFHRKTAQAFRKLLASGGKRDGMTLYREFRGAEPSRKPLLKARGFWVEPDPQPTPEEEIEEQLKKRLAPKIESKDVIIK